MRVLVLGAGAIGGYFGGRLLEAGVAPGQPACCASGGFASASRETSLDGRGPISGGRP
jgi:hypothetical protein